MLGNFDDGLVLFFVVSGYLISGPFVSALVGQSPLPGLSRYALRRACRILPAFWVALLAVAVLLPPQHSALGAQAPTHWWQVPVHALLLQNVVPGQLITMLKVDWTLENEVLFYLLVPLGALAVVARVRRVGAAMLSSLVAGVWLASAAIAFGAGQLPLFTDGSAIARYTIGSILGLFCPGILVAIALTAEGRTAGGIPGAINALLRRRRLALATALGLFGSSLGIYEVGIRSVHPFVYDLRWQTAAAGCAVVLALAVTSGSRVHSVTRLLAPIGLVSYGIYLWHTIVLRIVDHTGLAFSADTWGSLAWPANCVLVVAATLPLATASWLLVERPALRWAASRGDRAGKHPRVATA